MIRANQPVLRPATVLAGALTLALAGCGGGGGGGSSIATPTPVPSGQQTFFGASTAIGSGTGRAFVTRDGDVPVEAGIEFTGGIVNGLPNLQMGNAHEFKLPVPPELDVTLFKGISLDYSPGHPPEGNQSTPHFHPTFFFFSEAERRAVQPGATAGRVPIDEPELPPSHISTGDIIPTEGLVFFDANLKSYNERPFNSTTYQYDFWNGHMNLIQLGVARAFIPQKRDESDVLVQPQRYPRAGYFPTHYQFHYDSSRNLYRMFVDRFVFMSGALTGRGTLPDLSNSAGQSTLYGLAEPVGNGLARTYVTRAAGGPGAVGIEFNPAAFSGLPLVASERAQDFPLPVPAQLAPTPFKSISLIWTPGHQPPSSEGVPFFQGNFWLIRRPERNAIFPPTLPITPVPPSAVPAGLVSAGVLVPFEGTPFIDPRNPQWLQRFTTTRPNYDFWQGKMDAIQVSATDAFLNNKQQATGTLAQPRTVPIAGQYPTSYRVKFDSSRQVYTISVEGFASR